MVGLTSSSQPRARSITTTVSCNRWEAGKRIRNSCDSFWLRVLATVVEEPDPLRLATGRPGSHGWRTGGHPKLKRRRAAIRLELLHGHDLSVGIRSWRSTREPGAPMTPPISCAVPDFDYEIPG